MTGRRGVARPAAPAALCVVLAACGEGAAAAPLRIVALCDSETSPADLRSNPNTRTAVKEAPIVLLGVGGADLDGGDDDFAAGTCRAEAR